MQALRAIGAIAIGLALGLLAAGSFVRSSAEASPSVGATSRNHPPTVSFAGVPPSSLPTETVVLTLVINDPDGDMANYVLSWGDGASSSGVTGPGGDNVTVRHAFASLGTYQAPVTVDDGRRGVANASTVLLVAEPAYLRVRTNPPVPGKIFVDGVPRDEWGLAWVKVGPGTRVISFGPVAGMGTPDPIVVGLVSGQTSEVVGEYRVHGTIRVTTEPVLPATIFLNGAPANDWGVWRSLPPGTHTVSFGRVAGYDPPAPQTVAIGPGTSVHVQGIFAPNPEATGEDPSTFGYLRVTTINAFGYPVGSQVLVDGEPRDEWGLAWMKIAPGPHRVSFSEVYQNVPPESATLSVTAEQTTEYQGTFTVDGVMRVVTEPAVPSTIFVDGIPRDDWGMFQTYAPGLYLVSFGEVEGYYHPGPVQVVVRAGELVVITATFAPASSAVLNKG